MSGRKKGELNFDQIADTSPYKASEKSAKKSKEKSARKQVETSIILPEGLNVNKNSSAPSQNSIHCRIS